MPAEGKRKRSGPYCVLQVFWYFDQTVHAHHALGPTSLDQCRRRLRSMRELLGSAAGAIKPVPFDRDDFRRCNGNPVVALGEIIVHWGRKKAPKPLRTGTTRSSRVGRLGERPRVV